MSQEHQGGIKPSINKDNVELEFTFIENELSFREMFFETLKDIRNKTDKELVLCYSGGADSVLVKWGLDYLEIPHRVMHQRYLRQGMYCNWEEAGRVPEETEFIDINVEDYMKSKFFQKNYVKDFPTSVHSSIQCELNQTYDPNDIFLVSCSSPYNIYKFGWRNDKRWSFCASNLWKTIGFKDFDYTGVFYDNASICYSLFDDLYKDQVRNQLETGKWEYWFKHIFFEHHFPECAELIKQKYNNNNFPYFKELVWDRTRAIYCYQIEDQIIPYDCYPQRTFVGLDMEEFFERITGNGTTVMKFKRDWCAFGDELIVDTPIQE